MKIIHLTYSDYIGGAGIAANRINRSLIKDNIKSKIWTDENLNKKNEYEKMYFSRNKIIKRLRRYLTWPLIKMMKTKIPIHQSISILPSSWARYVNESDADIVNLHWINREMISIKDISEIKKPIVWTLHDMWPFCGAEHYTSDNRWQKGYNINNRPVYESGFDLNRWIWKKKKNIGRSQCKLLRQVNGLLIAQRKVN